MAKSLSQIPIYSLLVVALYFKRMEPSVRPVVAPGASSRHSERWSSLSHLMGKTQPWVATTARGPLERVFRNRRNGTVPGQVHTRGWALGLRLSPARTARPPWAVRGTCS